MRNNCFSLFVPVNRAKCHLIHWCMEYSLDIFSSSPYLSSIATSDALGFFSETLYLPHTFLRMINRRKFAICTSVKNELHATSNRHRVSN